MKDKILSIIDRINEMLGQVLSNLVIVLMLVTLYDVIMRYAFNRPTKWAFTICVALMSLMVILGAGYVFLHKGHVAVDVIYRNFSPRVKAIMNLVTFTFIFIFCFIVIWKGGDLAFDSIRQRETDRVSLLTMPIYPFRVFVVVGGILLFLQAVVKFIRDLEVARSGKPLEEVSTGLIFSKSEEDSTGAKG